MLTEADYVCQGLHAGFARPGDTIEMAFLKIRGIYPTLYNYDYKRLRVLPKIPKEQGRFW